MQLGPVGFIHGRQVNDGFAKLVGMAGALGVHDLDGDLPGFFGPRLG
jgi:hypothetical protein